MDVLVESFTTLDRGWFAALLGLVFGATGILSILHVCLTALGMYGIFKKCGLQGWHAFIPCWNHYQRARCAGREMEGRLLLFTNIALRIIAAASAVVFNTTVLIMISVVSFILTIINFVYHIRVNLGLIENFRQRRIWILLTETLSAIPFLLWGWMKKYQPQWQVEDAKAVVETFFSGGKVKTMDNGLTVNLEQRTAREFFRKKVLLRDVHMYIKPGSMVLLLGGSGAGKTTLLNAVIGYEKAQAEISLNGGNVYGNYKKMLHEIGFVPQLDLMRGNDTVFRTLMDAAALRLPDSFDRAARLERVEEVMKVFGLTPVKNNLVTKLSGGQRKRLSIAMEFISNPSLFILDEPDSGLDGVMARELMEQLRAIADQGKIVIVITHTPDRVIDLFDDVIVLAKDANRTGRLAFYGSIQEAREFFGKEKMEEIVMSINRQEEGGEGRADEFIKKYAEVQHV